MVGKMDPSADVFLAQLKLMAARAERAQRQVTSGKKILVASDGPDEIGNILQLRAEMERNGQITTNLARVRSEVDTADSVIQRAVQVLDRAIVLANEGSGSLIDASRRSVLAEEVGAVQQQIVSLSQTSVEGRYIFGGDRDMEPSYQLNLASPTGVDRLDAFPACTRQIMHPSGSTFVVARTAQEIFDERDAFDAPTGNNVFAAVNALRTALESNDQPGVQAALVTLRQSSAHLNAQLGFYGAAQNRVSGALEDAEKLGLRLKQTLSQIEDADVTDAILELNQVELNQRAALSSRAQMNRQSLFDYLR